MSVGGAARLHSCALLGDFAKILMKLEIMTDLRLRSPFCLRCDDRCLAHWGDR
jgi:hypothetical protein